MKIIKRLAIGLLAGLLLLAMAGCSKKGTDSRTLDHFTKAFEDAGHSVVTLFCLPAHLDRGGRGEQCSPAKRLCRPGKRASDARPYKAAALCCKALLSPAYSNRGGRGEPLFACIARVFGVYCEQSKGKRGYACEYSPQKRRAAADASPGAGPRAAGGGGAGGKPGHNAAGKRGRDVYRGAGGWFARGGRAVHLPNPGRQELDV